LRLSHHEQEKSGVQKMRLRYEKIKKSIKPSKDLFKIFSKKENSNNNDPKKKVAKPGERLQLYSHFETNKILSSLPT
jgi:uncharacterized protein YeaO (DUF488 family)